MSNSYGEGEVKTWNVGDSFIFTFQAKRTGPYTLTITDWDTAGHTNVATKTINMKNGYNYRVKVRLGGVIYVETVGIPRNGLVAEYLFSGNANDTSGFGNHGTVYGAVLTTDRFGNTNMAYSFDGKDDYIACGISDVITNITETISISFWVRPYILNKNYILGRYANDLSGGWRFDIMGGYFVFGVGAPSKIERFLTNSLIPVNPGTYYHVVGIFDKPSGTAKLYVNNQVNIVTTWNDRSLTFYKITDPTIVYQLFIGTFTARGFNYFKGEIDDVRIYNRVLSDDEVLTLYNE